MSTAIDAQPSPSGRTVVGAADGPASTDLAELARWFFTQPSPRIMAALLAATGLFRWRQRSWRGPDAAVAAGVVALQPFTEWLIHTQLLHLEPHRVAGRTFDPVAARDHRRHHADPKDLRWVFVPLPTLGEGAALATALLALAPDRPRAATVALTAAALLLGYEWTHYLMHVGYQPRRRWFRSRWRTHRLHHYRNERYWFGVTTHLADQVLGTAPERSQVPRSATARALPAAS